MLRLKECLHICNISQSTIAAEIGWSRTQVSLTLNSGRFPVAAERFRARVRKFAEGNTLIMTWLSVRNLSVDALFDDLSGCELSLETQINALLGAAMLRGPLTTDITRLGRVSLFLLATMQTQGEGIDMTEIEKEASILIGGVI